MTMTYAPSIRRLQAAIAELTRAIQSGYKPVSGGRFYVAYNPQNTADRQFITWTMLQELAAAAHDLDTLIQQRERAAIERLTYTRSLKGDVEYCVFCKVLRGKRHGIHCPAGQALGECT